MRAGTGQGAVVQHPKGESQALSHTHPLNIIDYLCIINTFLCGTASNNCSDAFLMFVLFCLRKY